MHYILLPENLSSYGRHRSMQQPTWNIQITGGDQTYLHVAPNVIPTERGHFNCSRMSKLEDWTSGRDLVVSVCCFWYFQYQTQHQIIATGKTRNRVSIPGDSRRFSFLQSSQTVTGAHLVYSAATGTFSRQAKCAMRAADHI